jgi:hypothetical protein
MVIRKMKTVIIFVCFIGVNLADFVNSSEYRL